MTKVRLKNIKTMRKISAAWIPYFLLGFSVVLISCSLIVWKADDIVSVLLQNKSKHKPQITKRGIRETDDFVDDIRYRRRYIDPSISKTEKEEHKQSHKHDWGEDDSKNMENTQPPYSGRTLPGYARNLESALYELGVRKEVYAAVLSSHKSVDSWSDVVSTTWGGAVSQQQFFYTAGSSSSYKQYRVIPNALPLAGIAEEVAYSARHTLETLQYMCAAAPDDYNWYLVTKDSVYVDTEALINLVSTASWADHQLLDFKYEDQELGFVLSSAAFRKFCAERYQCTFTERSTSLYECIEQVCNTVWKTQEEIAEVVHTTTSMIERHLKTLDGQIHSAKEQIRNFQSNQQNSFELNLDDIFTQLYPSQTYLPLCNALERTRTSHYLVENDQRVTIQGCSQEGEKLLIMNSTSYRQARQLSEGIAQRSAESPPKQDNDKSSSGSEVSDTTFALVSSGAGYEGMYEFYFTTNNGRGSERVTQVVLTQNLKTFGVVESFVLPFRKMVFVTSLSNATEDDIGKFLSNIDNVCHGLRINESVCDRALLSIPNFDFVHLDLAIEKKYRNSIGATMVLEENIESILSTISPTEILLFTPIDTAIDSTFLQRCQINTQLNKTVYFPIPKQPTENSESWKIDNNDILCIANGDFLEYSFSGNYSITSLFDNLYKQETLALNRNIEPGITYRINH